MAGHFHRVRNFLGSSLHGGICDATLLLHGRPSIRPPSVWPYAVRVAADGPHRPSSNTSLLPATHSGRLALYSRAPPFSNFSRREAWTVFLIMANIRQRGRQSEGGLGAFGRPYDDADHF